MNIATRYAKALWESSLRLSADQQEQLYDDMRVLHECLVALPALRAALANPVESKEEKRRLLDSAGGGKNSPLYGQFVNLVLDHRRANQMIWIASIYTDMYRRAQGISRVVIESAFELPQTTRELLQQRLAQLLSGSVECRYVVNPDLIGGFRIRVNDKRIDASYRRKLEDIRNAILNQG